MHSNQSYYIASLEVYRHISHLYPSFSIWVTGHSLGGGVAALLGRRHGIPAVTFNAPGDRLAAMRLRLFDEDDNIYNIGSTGDPVFMGACNGMLAICAIAGYAMETGCHSGFECVYDIVNDNGTYMSMGHHGIKRLIETMKLYESAPKCSRRDDCVDCYMWEYED